MQQGWIPAIFMNLLGEKGPAVSFPRRPCSRLCCVALSWSWSLLLLVVLLDFIRRKPFWPLPSTFYQPYRYGTSTQTFSHRFHHPWLEHNVALSRYRGCSGGSTVDTKQGPHSGWCSSLSAALPVFG